MTGNLQAPGAAGGPARPGDLSREPPVPGGPASRAAGHPAAGVTPTPSALARAIADSGTHGAQIRDLPARGAAAGEATPPRAPFDVRWARDVLRPVHNATATGILPPARPYPPGTA